MSDKGADFIWVEFLKATNCSCVETLIEPVLSVPVSNAPPVDFSIMKSTKEWYPLTCPGVHLSRGSLVRGFICPGFSCPEVHLSGGSLVRTFVCYNFLVQVRNSKGPPLSGCAIRFDIRTFRSPYGDWPPFPGSTLPGRCCSAGIYKGDAVLLYS